MDPALMKPHITENYVIWSFEHDAWWRPGSWGYTTELEDAGHFTQAEAEKIVTDANIVEINEQAVTLSDATRHGPPTSPKKRRRHQF
jgi:hypothetical protein